MSADELTLRDADSSDMARLATFMRAHEQPHVTQDFLRHWYFDAWPMPGGVTLAEREHRLLGMATMSLHHFGRGAQRALVGMPQKVLTHAAVRGQGVFGKVYRANERSCLLRGADFFLTVTNAASTPIFLERFGYRRLAEPKLAILTPRPGRHDTSSWSVECAAAMEVDSDHAWGLRRDARHLRWRFEARPDNDYLRVRCGPPDRPYGVVVMKRARKRGLPVALLLHVAPAGPETSGALLRSARKLAWRQRCAAVLCLHRASLAQGLRDNHALLVGSGFNLLVKAGASGSTEALAKEPFELALGDLDFF